MKTGEFGQSAYIGIADLACAQPIQKTLQKTATKIEPGSNAKLQSLFNMNFMKISFSPINLYGRSL
jgi:hypothetical protein